MEKQEYEFISSADGNSIQVNDDADGANEGYLLNKQQSLLNLFVLTLNNVIYFV